MSHNVGLTAASAICNWYSHETISDPLKTDLRTYQEVEASLQAKIDQIIQILNDDSTKDYILLHKQFDEINATLEETKNSILYTNTRLYQLVEERQAPQRNKLAEIQALLHVHNKKYEQQKTWVEKLELPKELLFSHPDFVEFATKSGIAYMIALFHDSKHHHAVVIDEEMNPCIKVNGQYKKWDELKQQLIYDEAIEEVVLKTDPTKKWNYISPDGLVQRGRYEYETIYPIELLDDATVTALQNHAAEFFNGRETLDPDPGLCKECVLQIVTSHRNTIPLNWATKNMQEVYPEHVTIRIIKGNALYSYNLDLRKEARDAVFQNYPSVFFSTTTSNIGIPDYEEPYPCAYKRTTSIPLTTTRANVILDWSTRMNAQGIRFNFLKQNCDRVGELVLKMAGIHVDTRTSLPSFVYSSLPNLEDIPVIGTTIASINIFVTQTISPLWQEGAAWAPQWLLTSIEVVVETVTFPLKKIRTIFFNSVVMYYGGAIAQNPSSVTHNSERDDDLPYFNSLMEGLSDLWKEGITDMYHPRLLVEWQKKQPTTTIHHYTGKPRLVLL